MTKLLLSIHVLAAIIAIGPVTVAASMFPAVTRRASAVSASTGDRGAASVPQALHRICRVYAVVGVVVPVFGFATANSLHVLGDPWLIVSIVLTLIAAVVLAALVLPGQSAALAALGQGSGTSSAARRLAMYTGVFNLLWAVVTVLMIVRPGSTTGA
ncbi:hypothetical protein SNS2_5034 [Streptomyces netropsis]|uniref:Preprotein translocase subunit SecG n=1 Tax=Streptomyces syringium TaxID=76729 RepID=A0ABS4YC80_9ACTN|nr:hypothetical protein [Streptomyces syringium]MBP2406394.1 preprotein translocase subunit SecG [Streptomyces syringium]SPE63710.1 hypothetical protein SNS2_5034 [Streptomyces netropsis]